MVDVQFDGLEGIAAQIAHVHGLFRPFSDLSSQGG